MFTVPKKRPQNEPTNRALSGAMALPGKVRIASETSSLLSRNSPDELTRFR